MALRDRLAAARQAETVESPAAAASLSVIRGDRPSRSLNFEASGVEPSDAIPGRLAMAKSSIHAMLVKRYAQELDAGDREAVRAKVESLTDEYLRNAGGSAGRGDHERLVEALLDEVFGLGALQPLLDDPTVSEIMINNPRQVYVERFGRMTLSPVVFESTAQLRQVIDRIVTRIGRRVDETSPMCDARLRDGSRVNVVLPPLALDGPCMTIRKFSRHKLGPDDLLASGSATAGMLHYLQACVRGRLSVLVSGGTSSGKTTLLNLLSGFIPTDERIVTVEDTAELQLRQDHVIRLEARPANVEGTGAVVIRDLVRNSLRMRPDRVIVGECRGAETFDMLQAMNTGHDGSMSTIHANSAADALSRLESMMLMSGPELPVHAVRKMIASAIDVIVQTERVRGGTRKIVSIAEITGMNGVEVHMQELFGFRQTGLDANGYAEGRHVATGHRSIHLEHFVGRGETLPASIFEPTV